MRGRLNIAKVVGTLQPTQTKDLLSPKVTSQGPKVTYCEKNSAHDASADALWISPNRAVMCEKTAPTGCGTSLWTKGDGFGRAAIGCVDES
jgi:hypothetical protein